MEENLRNVPFFNYPRIFKDDKDDLIRIFNNVGERGAFIMQKDLEQFEKDLSDYLCVNHAIGVANATDGLEIAWQAIGLRSSDEVIISSHTMLATASAVVTAGAKPVPVDIGYDNLIDPDAIEDAINPHTIGIMPTQLNGRTCNMDRIMKLAKKFNLFVVEDAAQALGSKFKGRFAGTFGKASAISFYPAKVLGCLGDAGAVITDDDYIADRVWQLHDHGRDKEGEVKSWGRNSRMDNLQAAILSFRLKSYSAIINRRRRIATLYQEMLGDMEELELPPAPESDPDHFDIYQNYELQAFRRDELKQFLKENGIGTLVQWGGKAVHQHERLGFTCKLPKTESFFKKCLMLPMNIFVNDEDVEYICNTIKKFYGRLK
jgi:dTDP-4-amino-4,6-dideoxygalactose transaminase